MDFDGSEAAVRVLVWVLSWRHVILLIGFMIWLYKKVKEFLESSNDERLPQTVPVAPPAAVAAATRCPCPRPHVHNRLGGLRIQIDTDLLEDSVTDDHQRASDERTDVETGEPRLRHSLKEPGDRNRTYHPKRDPSNQTVFVGKFVQIHSSNQIQVGDACTLNKADTIDRSGSEDALCTSCHQKSVQPDLFHPISPSTSCYDNCDDEIDGMPSHLPNPGQDLVTATELTLSESSENLVDREENVFVEARLKIMKLTKERREYLQQQEEFQRGTKGGVRASLHKLLRLNKDGDQTNK